mmetsp:Transcript_52598/g.125866  ORF Transcript_52598/g.125866 Transcript_52598/m.125866 type:complete len:203 (+) Transcript_52598:329-937(+)
MLLTFSASSLELLSRPCCSISSFSSSRSRASEAFSSARPCAACAAACAASFSCRASAARWDSSSCVSADRHASRSARRPRRACDSSWQLLPNSSSCCCCSAAEALSASNLAAVSAPRRSSCSFSSEALSSVSSRALAAAFSAASRAKAFTSPRPSEHWVVTAQSRSNRPSLRCSASSICLLAAWHPCTSTARPWRANSASSA